MLHSLLNIQHLSIDFITEEDHVHALQDISLSISPGETVALVGESGSGKSVCALSILGLLPSPPAQIKQGKILFQASEQEKVEDLLQLSQKNIEAIRGKSIGMIFQEPMTSLNPLMRCGEQVSETIRQHMPHLSTIEADQQTIKLFEEVKLPQPEKMMRRYPHELSGGQKQRVMIAMAICCEPALLIADEPTTALDVTVQKSILELLKELQRKKNMAILFITHDLNLVKSFADKVMVMYKSRCVEYGSTAAIFENPQENYTKGLLACRPSRVERLRYLQTVEEILNHSTKETEIIDIKKYQHRIDELQTTNAILEIKDLHVWYPTKTSFFGKVSQWYKAVEGVNLRIPQGATLGLVGESGCGKTTIGKSIVKLNAITSGDILYKGQSIQTLSKQALDAYRKEVQIIFQDPYSSLNPRVSIGEAIKEPMEVHGIFQSNQRKEKVHELLQKVGLLPAHYQRYPHEFSGGQRQRICIARALALEAKLIICDESVSALDVSVQAQVLNLLVSLREEFGLSYLFISHDLGVVKHISDFVAVMRQGKIIEWNDAEKVYHKPEQVYTQELIHSSL
ncbi:MAG: ABC transporter ATP-binding protein [Chitinophagaceae bacterium]|nr:ABC transporter ATP-binding protein [Chitinophagaceae bacterium]